MKIDISKNPVEKGFFNIDLSGDISFVVTSLGIFLNVSKEDLTKLADFANYALKDAD